MNPKVLVSCPSSNRHDYVIEEWVRNVKDFAYDNFDILVVDTSTDDGLFAKKLEALGVKVIRHIWNPAERHPLQMLADAREVIRKYVLDNGYDYLFSLDSDILPPKDALKELVNADKDQIGYLVHVYHRPWPLRPAVFKSGFFIKNHGLDYYSWSWTKKYKRQIKEVYANALGCLLIKRKVLEAVPFRTHPTFIYGEDLWFYNEAHEKGFKSYCLVKRVKHKNTSWQNVMLLYKHRPQQLWFAIGPEDATGVEIMEGKDGGSRKLEGEAAGEQGGSSDITNPKG